MSDTGENITQNTQRLESIELDAALSDEVSQEAAHERDIAIFALLEDNSFSLTGHATHGCFPP